MTAELAHDFTEGACAVARKRYQTLDEVEGQGGGVAAQHLRNRRDNDGSLKVSKGRDETFVWEAAVIGVAAKEQDNWLR